MVPALPHMLMAPAAALGLAMIRPEAIPAWYPTGPVTAAVLASSARKMLTVASNMLDLAGRTEAAQACQHARLAAGLAVMRAQGEV